MLSMTKKDLDMFAKTAPYRYKVYDIPKRSGKGTRTIAHPSRQLKFIQKILLSQFEILVTPHNSVYSYRKGLGVKQNAQVHMNNSYLLKMDFKDFFPSITPELLFLVMAKLGCPISVSEQSTIGSLLFWRETRNSNLKLSIGAPTSPFISNIVMYYFDEEISKYCLKNRIEYSRYADDITFSTNKKNVLFLLPTIVSSILVSEGYSAININTQKTVFSSKAHNRHVTGVTLTNDNKISIGRKRKRLISSMVHKFSLGALTPEQILELKGNLAFAFHIDDTFYSSLCNKYSTEVMIRLK